MTYNDIRVLWEKKNKWDKDYFISLFGKNRGNDLWNKYVHYYSCVITFLILECNKKEIDTFLKK